MLEKKDPQKVAFATTNKLFSSCVAIWHKLLGKRHRA